LTGHGLLLSYAKILREEEGTRKAQKFTNHSRISSSSALREEEGRHRNSQIILEYRASASA
jgi:hypothetical protein